VGSSRGARASARALALSFGTIVSLLVGYTPLPAAAAAVSPAATGVPAAVPVSTRLAGPASCGAGCAVTVAAFRPSSPNADPNVGGGLGIGAALESFTFDVNVDNTRLPNDPDPKMRNGVAPTESFTPLVAVGDQTRNTVTLPNGRYLISVRAPDRKMWGRLITLPNDANPDGTLAVNVVLTEASAANPLPLGSIKVYVFRDDQWTNGAPDLLEGGLAGFKVELYEQTNSLVTADYHNFPLCDPAHANPTAPAPGSWPGCISDTDGFVEIDNLGPATYFAEVIPPDAPCNDDPNSHWYQTSTIDGGFKVQTSVEEGSLGAGSPTALAVDLIGNNPAKRTIYTFGFACSPKPFATEGTGEITGTARTLVSWADNVNTFGEPVKNPFVALSNAATDQTIYVGQGDENGNFDIQGVPAGTYTVSIWDEPLSSIFSFITVTVASGQTVDMNTTDPLNEQGVGIPRWFGWTSGTVYKDLNRNGVRDAGEPVIPNTDMDQRWRDGSIKETTFTDASGRYEYPTAEGGAVGKWIINEQGFARWSVTGASVHDERTGAVTQIPSDQGGALLVNVLDNPGHRAEIDWGKIDYAAGEAGQIVGVTYWATTRNEFQAGLQAHEDYEPGIPNVVVYLEGLGPDGIPNTADDVLLNKYVTDHWQQPGVCSGIAGGYRPSTQKCADGTDPAAPRTDVTTVPAGGTYDPACSLTASDGSDLSAVYNPLLSKDCIELPYGAAQVKDGAFDGGYAFADYCPKGFDETAPDETPCFADASPHDLTLARVATEALVPGTYITHAIMPKDPTDTRDCDQPGDLRVSTAKGSIPGGGTGCLYRIVREEDVNVDLGNQFTPAIPPPPCVGDDHVIDQTTLTSRSPFYGVAGAHAALCDKRLIVLHAQQNYNADFNLMTNFTSVVDVQTPGRLVGWALNDLVFDNNPSSLTFTGNQPVANVPVGVYHRYDSDPTHWRLFTTVTTSELGTYEVLLPSTETFNCPIPQGPCPGMYRLIVNDPGTKAHPNANYDPTFLPGSDYIVDIWPGLTTQLDSPLIPISEFACETPQARPELFQVSRPWVRPGAAGDDRRITIQGSFPGAATANVVQLSGLGSLPTVNLTPANGGIASWTVSQIVIQLPASIAAGQYQMTIVAAGGERTLNAITIHVLGAGYDPTLVTVGPPDPTRPYLIQDAVDAAPDGSLIVLGAGVYRENVVLWKPVKLQGLGVGGTIGARNVQAPAARFTVLGSIIDGRFFAENEAHWNSVVAAHPMLGTNLPRGADITVGAQSPTAYETRSRVVMDPAITSADLGRSVAGTGIPAGATITQVTPGTSFTLSVAPSGPVSGPLTITKTDTGDVGKAVFGPGIAPSTTITAVAAGTSFVMNNRATDTAIGVSLGIGQRVDTVSTTNNSTTVTDASVTAATASSYVGKAVFGAGIRSGAFSVITAANGTTHTFTMSRSANATAASVSLTIARVDTATTNDGFAVRDAAIVAGDAGRAVSGAGIPANTTITAVAAGTGFAMNNRATATATGVTLTITRVDATASSAPPSPMLAARIDGIGMTGAHATGAGGIQVQTNVNSLQITNNGLELNGGVFAGGIGIGQPDHTNSNNRDAAILNNLVIGNGGIVRSGGIGIFAGSDGYEIGNTLVCGNTSAEYGAGISHWGLSPNGRIHDNEIIYNEAIDSGAGVSIQSAANPNPADVAGSGAVVIERNRIEANFSGDDGGGIFVLEALTAPIDLRNNIITDNVAADLGGGIMLDDSTNVRIVNNTVANNVTTASSAASVVGVPHAAGLTSEATNQDLVAAGKLQGTFSNPAALFNNIFWHNQAFTLSHIGVGATLISQGFIDFEVHGTTSSTDTFTPRYSDLTNDQILGSDGVLHSLPSGQGNTSGDPGFVAPFDIQLTVGFSRLDPRMVSVQPTLEQLLGEIVGDYHLIRPTTRAQITASSVIDRGVRCSNTPVPAPAAEAITPCGTAIQAPFADFDRELRPQLLLLAPVLQTRYQTPWDLGADELPTLVGGGGVVAPAGVNNAQGNNNGNNGNDQAGEGGQG
jgi:hypothetical protein